MLFLPLAEIFRTIKRYTCIHLSSPAELQQKFFLGNLSLGIAFLANMIGLFLLGGTS